MLDGTSVLIVEDDSFIAMDLARTVKNAGGMVIGPVGTVKAGIALLADEPVEAAILDANLADGEVSPLAQILLAVGIPLVLYTGSALPEALEPWSADIALIPKPASRLVVAKLAAMIKA
jgi:hypothetical protein